MYYYSPENADAFFDGFILAFLICCAFFSLFNFYLMESYKKSLLKKAMGNAENNRENINGKNCRLFTKETLSEYIDAVFAHELNKCRIKHDIN